MHFNVERTPQTFYLKDIQFATIDQLVRYYGHTDVPNKEMIRGIRLQSPVTRAPNQYNPYISMYGNKEKDAQNYASDVYIHPVS